MSETILPLGYETVRQSDEKVSVTRKNFPWIPSDTHVRLTEISLNSGKKYFLGSLLRGKQILKAAIKLAKQTVWSDQSNDDFYKEIKALIDSGNDYSPNIVTLRNPRGNRAIYYVKNDHVRVYFARMDPLRVASVNGQKIDIPVIIKLAVCHKNYQKEVLSVISNEKP